MNLNKIYALSDKGFFHCNFFLEGGGGGGDCMN